MGGQQLSILCSLYSALGHMAHSPRKKTCLTEQWGVQTFILRARPRPAAPGNTPNMELFSATWRPKAAKGQPKVHHKPPNRPQLPKTIKNIIKNCDVHRLTYEKSSSRLHESSLLIKSMVWKIYNLSELLDLKMSPKSSLWHPLGDNLASQGRFGWPAALDFMLFV